MLTIWLGPPFAVALGLCPYAFMWVLPVPAWSPTHVTIGFTLLGLEGSGLGWGSSVPAFLPPGLGLVHVLMLNTSEVTVHTAD